MRALIIYESIYGNTRDVALALSRGLSQELQVETFEVASAPRSIDGYDVMMVGGPTHAFTMSTLQSRIDAAGKTDRAPVSTTAGIRDWIDSVAPPRDNTPFATFDTRYDKPTWITGSAARRATSRLQRRGFSRLSPAMSFFIQKFDGPLVDGETDRAFEWGERMAVRLVMAG